MSHIVNNNFKFKGKKFDKGQSFDNKEHKLSNDELNHLINHDLLIPSKVEKIDEPSKPEKPKK